MILVRIVVNAAVLAVELGLIAAVAWIAWQWPIPFALVTGLLSLALGLRLEAARLRNELAFYLGRAVVAPRVFLIGSVALGEASLKALLAAVAALLTFAGTDNARLWWVAAVFAGCVFAGTSMLRWLVARFGAVPSRWGYFRLAPLLGLLFSSGMSLLAGLQIVPVPALSDLARRAVLETPQIPTVSQASELLFQFKQYFDAIVVGLLGLVLPAPWASVAGVLVSVNMLTGFVAAIYAVVIADIVRALEGEAS